MRYQSRGDTSNIGRRIPDTLKPGQLAPNLAIHGTCLLPHALGELGRVPLLQPPETHPECASDTALFWVVVLASYITSSVFDDNHQQSPDIPTKLISPLPDRGLLVAQKPRNLFLRVCHLSAKSGPKKHNPSSISHLVPLLSLLLILDPHYPPFLSIMALDSFFHNKIESMKLEIIQGQAVLRRLEAQRNDYNSRVRLLREELGLLQQPGSYVGEVVKVMGTKNVLVKVHPEGKYGMPPSPFSRHTYSRDSYTRE